MQLSTHYEKHWSVLVDRPVPRSSSKVDITLLAAGVEGRSVDILRERYAEEIVGILQDGARLTTWNWARPIPLRAVEAEAYASTFQARVLIDTHRPTAGDLSYSVRSSIHGLSDEFENPHSDWLPESYRRSRFVRRHLPSNMLWVYAPLLSREIASQLLSSDELAVWETRKQSGMLNIRNPDLEGFKGLSTSFSWSDRARDDVRIFRKVRAVAPIIPIEPEPIEDDEEY